jgi:hypothetical protein
MEVQILAIVVAGVAGLALGAIAGYYLFRYQSSKLVDSAQRQAERIIASAETKAKESLVRAGDETLRLRGIRPNRSSSSGRAGAPPGGGPVAATPGFARRPL